MKLTTLFSRPYNLLFGYDIFISYTRLGSKDYAARLYEQLTSLDYSCFIDRKEVPGGRSLNSSLNSALKVSKTLILIGTETAFQREYVQLEFQEFAKTGRPIIPIDVGSALTAGDVLQAKPWTVIRERDIVRIDETKEALARGLPSPEVYEGIQNLFQFTRRNVVRRRWTTAAVVVIVATALMAIWQAKSARAQTRLAEEQTNVANTQTQLAKTRQVEIERQTRALEKEQKNLKAKNEELKQKTTELESKTEEALRNAEKARTQEALARSNAEKALRRQKSAESLYLAEQGRREYETNPLLGLAVSLEALENVPSDDSSTRTTIERNIKDRVQYGRIAKLDKGDFGQPYFLKGAKFFVLDRPRMNGELRSAHTGLPIETLAGEVMSVSGALEKFPPGEFVSTSSKDNSKLADSPYFIIHYNDKPDELRRRADASLVTRGVSSVEYDSQIPFFLVQYKDQPSELRRVDNDTISVSLSHKEPKANLVRFVPDAPYFLVRYGFYDTELRRVDSGAVVPKFSTSQDPGAVVDKLSEATDFLVSDLSFSHDLSLYSLSNSLLEEIIPRSMLIRTKTNQPVDLGKRMISGVFFSPFSTHFVVAYRYSKGELRRTDREDEVITLSGKVSDVVFNPADKHFVVLYSDAPGEMRNAIDKQCILLPSDIKSVAIDKNLLGFRAVYKGDGVGLIQDAGGQLEELPVSTLGSVAPKPTYTIARNSISGAKELWRSDKGTVVQLAGRYSSANEFEYLESIPYIKVGVQNATESHVIGLLHTTSGNIIQLDEISCVGRIMTSPRRTLFYTDCPSHLVYRVDSGRAIASFSLGVFFSPDDKYLVASLNHEFVWTDTGKKKELVGTVIDATFNDTASLVRIKYADQRTELLRTSDGQVMATAKDIMFMTDQRYLLVTDENSRSELWSAQDTPHRLAVLETGIAGTQVDASEGRVFVWYDDRRAYLLDLKWLKDIRGHEENLTGKDLIKLSCEPFTVGVIGELDLKRFVQRPPLQICRE